MAVLPEPHDAGLDLFAALLEDSGELAAVLEPDGRFRYLNPAGRRLLGLAARRSARRPGSAFDLVAAVDRRVLEVGAPPRPRGPAVVGRQPRRGHRHRRRAPDPLDAARLARHGAARRSPGSPATSARSGPSTSASTRRCSRTSSRASPTARSSSTASTSPCAARTSGAPAVTLLVVGLDRFRERNERLPAGGRDELLHAVGAAARRPARPRRQRGAVGRRRVRVPVRGRRPARTTGPTGSPPAFAEPFRVGRDGRVPHARRSARPPAAPGAVTTDQLLRQADAAVPDGPAARRAARCNASTTRCRTAPAGGPRWRTRCAARPTAGSSSLHYQPEVSLRTNRIVALEALVRWQHPEWGLVAPGEFVPVAEGSNLILEVGGWVLRDGHRAVRPLAGPLRGPHAHRRRQHLGPAVRPGRLRRARGRRPRALRRRGRRPVPRDHRERPHGRRRPHASPRSAA